MVGGGRFRGGQAVAALIGSGRFRRGSPAPWRCRFPFFGFFSAALAGCAGQPAGDGPGPLVVAADVGFAPHAMMAANGEVEGFNVDLAREIARSLGRPGYRIVDSEWSSIFSGLYAGKFEFVIAPTTITEGRAHRVLLSEGYLDTDPVFLRRRDAPELEDLDQLRGEEIAVNNGSAYDLWATENREALGFEVLRYGKNADAVQAVLSGRAFANLVGESVALWAVRKNPAVRADFRIRAETAFAIAFRNEDRDLRNEVETILECLKADGTLARIHRDWLGAEPAPGSAAVTPRDGFGPPGLPGFEATPGRKPCR